MNERWIIEWFKRFIFQLKGESSHERCDSPFDVWKGINSPFHYDSGESFMKRWIIHMNESERFTFHWLFTFPLWFTFQVFTFLSMIHHHIMKGESPFKRWIIHEFRWIMHEKVNHRWKGESSMKRWVVQHMVNRSRKDES